MNFKQFLTESFSFGGWEGKGKTNLDGDFEWIDPSPTAKFIIDIVSNLNKNSYGVDNPITQVPKQKLTKEQKTKLKNKDWKLIEVNKNNIVSHQTWIRPYDLIVMTSIDPKKLNDEERYPTAVKYKNKIRIIDGNHRAALYILLNLPLKVRLL